MCKIFTYQTALVFLFATFMIWCGELWAVVDYFYPEHCVNFSWQSSCHFILTEQNESRENQGLIKCPNMARMMTQQQHLPALCSVSVCVCVCLEQKAPRNSSTTAASRFPCQPQGLFMLEHAQFGSLPCNNSQWERAHTPSHTDTHSLPHSTPARSGSETEREAARCAAELLTHTHRPANTHSVTTKVSTQTCKYCSGFYFLAVRSL